MKLNELYEAKAPDFYDVLNDAHQYLQIPGAMSGYVFRGLRDQPSSSFNRLELGQVELDWKVLKRNPARRPVATTQFLHDASDEFFLKKFGWRARSQGVFGTGRRATAADYGSPFVMLPLGPVEFAWSSVIEDLYVTFTERRPTPTTAEEVEDLLDASDYKNTDLATAIRYGNEIMFNCDKYLIIEAHPDKSVMRTVLGF